MDEQSFQDILECHDRRDLQRSLAFIWECLLHKYADIYARRKVINFAKAFLKYLAQTRFDGLYEAFTLFLAMPKAFKERKHITSRIVTTEDNENVLSAIKKAHEDEQIDEYYYLNYRAIATFGAFTGQRPLATIARLTIGQFKDDLTQEKPVLETAIGVFVWPTFIVIFARKFMRYDEMLLHHTSNLTYKHQNDRDGEGYGKSRIKKMRRYWLNTFANIGQDPAWWVTQAESLKKTAELAILKAEELTNAGAHKDRIIDFTEMDQIEIGYRYVAGVTIENLLKAIMILDDPSLVKAKQISKEIRGHDMWTRHADSRLEIIKELLTDTEQQFLKPLEYYVAWKGRYPIATNATKYAEGHSVTSDPNVTTYSLKEFDACFSAIYEKRYSQTSRALKSNLHKTRSRCNTTFLYIRK